LFTASDNIFIDKLFDNVVIVFVFLDTCTTGSGGIPHNQQHIIPLHESQRESFALRVPREQQRDKQVEEKLFDQQ
jgi:hypothetical protein